MAELTSKLAFQRAKDSGLLKNMQLGLMDAYCKAWEELPWAKDKGITANEIQNYVWDTQHYVLNLLDDRKLNHLNKLQAPLRRKGFLKSIEPRDCNAKGTLAKADVLTFGAGHKEKKNDKHKKNVELFEDFIYVSQYFADRKVHIPAVTRLLKHFMDNLNMEVSSIEEKENKYNDEIQITSLRAKNGYYFKSSESKNSTLSQAFKLMVK